VMGSRSEGVEPMLPVLHQVLDFTLAFSSPWDVLLALCHSRENAQELEKAQGKENRWGRGKQTSAAPSMAQLYPLSVLARAATDTVAVAGLDGFVGDGCHFLRGLG
jgi:hypothetical protein